MESRSYSSIRKGRKLLAEKKRRNRINECLNQIKTLMSDDFVSNKMDLDSNKMEKVEILESTVEFIRKTKYSPSSCPRESQVTYQTGFTRCVQEMMCFLNGVTEVSDNLKYRLLQHITSNSQPIQSTRNINYLQYPGIPDQHVYQQHYVRYNPSLAVPLDIKSETIEAVDNNNNNNYNMNNIVWRPW